MLNGFGRGYGQRGGMGFGFRGSSPPWPYVGRGRGGLPRCGYFLSGAAGVPMASSFQQPLFHATTSPAAGASPFAPPMAKEEELSSLKGEAEAIKVQLEQIEAKMRDLENEKREVK